MTVDLAPFFDDVPQRLAAAHLVIARAGASTVAELTALGRPAILIPYPFAIDDHQSANARALAATGAAWVLPQQAFDADSLAGRLDRALRRRRRGPEQGRGCGAHRRLPGRRRQARRCRRQRRRARGGTSHHHRAGGPRMTAMKALPLGVGTIHFVGIGGIGMSGIAELLHNLGYAVQGTDRAENANTRRLRGLGIPVHIGHDAPEPGRRPRRRHLVGGQGATIPRWSPPASACCRSFAAPRCWPS